MATTATLISSYFIGKAKRFVYVKTSLGIVRSRRKNETVPAIESKNKKLKLIKL